MLNQGAAMLHFVSPHHAGASAFSRRGLLAGATGLPFLTPASAAQPGQPLQIGYIVNGPERTIFEEKFEFGMRERRTVTS